MHQLKAMALESVRDVGAEEGVDALSGGGATRGGFGSGAAVGTVGHWDSSSGTADRA